MRRFIAFGCTALPILFAACSDGDIVGGGFGGPDAGGGALLDGKAVGEACTESGSDACRGGLECVDGTCAFAGTKTEGKPCVAAGECGDALQCALGRCAAAGAGAEGSGCLLDTDCEKGLRCGIVGFGAQCVPEGTKDFGQSCGISADCYAGLICAPGEGGGATACAPIPTSGPLAGAPFGIPVPPALTCEPESGGTVTAHFEVPGAEGTSATGDFFRLPFPNDARITNGKIDLTGFPTPGTALLGFDPVQIYLDAITANERAWGTYPTVLFRFSGPIDFDSTRAPGTIQFLDITDPASPGNAGALWGSSPGGGKYICHNWVGVRRGQGSPLEPGHTYVVYMTTAVRDGNNGNPVERSPQFEALLAPAAPADAALANGYAAYKPLRDYLAAEGTDPATILTAAVFTAAPVRSLMENLAQAVAAAPVPTASGWVKCGGTAVSPCPQAEGDRACGAANADYDEYHALIDLPIFQKGTAPYLDAGGDIDTTGPVRTESVCAALSVPKGAMPAAGFPLAVFGHGTGGSFRSHLRDEVAGALARATPKLAVLGYDQVQHGPRRGSSTASPNVLFFNFKNPAAARGNPLQGAADILAVGRLARTLTVAGAVTGGSDVAFDPAAVVYYGHSQGSMHASLALPYTNDFVATVLSGNGASLMDALLSKTAPENIAAAVPFALGGDYDGKKLFGTVNHPVLTILQQWIDPSDPLNFAYTLTRERPTGINPKSVFQTYGLGDTYSPPVTMETYATAASLQVATHDPSVATPDPIATFEEQPVPLSGNYAALGTTVTHALRQYKNTDGKDGHFVVFDVPSATADVVRFLSMAAAGVVPAVGQ